MAFLNNISGLKDLDQKGTGTLSRWSSSNLMVPNRHMTTWTLRECQVTSKVYFDMSIGKEKALSSFGKAKQVGVFSRGCKVSCRGD